MRVFAITGVMHAGKSTLARSLAWQNPLTIIEIDSLRRDMIISGNPKHDKLREMISHTLHVRSYGKHFILDRVSLTEAIFKSKESLQTYNSLTAPFFREQAANIIKASQTDCVLVWSHLLEDYAAYQSLLTPHPLVVFVTVPDNVQQQRLKDNLVTGLPQELIAQRLKVSLTQSEKLELLHTLPEEHILITHSTDNVLQTTLKIQSKLQ